MDGFAKVFLEPGETKTVTLEVPLKELKFWNSWREEFAVESGDYAVWFGANCEADAVLARAEISISGEWKAPLSAVTMLADRSILKVGATTDLELSATLENAVHLNVSDLPIMITSSDENVAIIVNGRVKAVGAGAIKLTATLTLDGVTKTDSVGICVQ